MPSRRQSADPLEAQPLTCAFGGSWTSKGCGPCPGCLAEAAQMARGFARSVFFGEFDSEGYTPADRAAQAKRRAAEAVLQS